MLCWTEVTNNICNIVGDQLHERPEVVTYYSALLYVLDSSDMDASEISNKHVPMYCGRISVALLSIDLKTGKVFFLMVFTFNS